VLQCLAFFNELHACGSRTLISSDKLVGEVSFPRKIEGWSLCYKNNVKVSEAWRPAEG